MQVDTRGAARYRLRTLNRRPRTPLAALIALLLCVSSAAAEDERSILRGYERDDRLHPPVAGAVLFVGSSTMHRWAQKGAIEQAFPGVPIIDRGVPGTNYRFLVQHIDTLVFAYRPRRIVVYSGDNDLSGGASPEAVANEARTFVDAIHARMPRVGVVVISVKPSPHLARRGRLGAVRDTNARLASLARSRPWLTFVDIYARMTTPEGEPRAELFEPSGQHLSAAGYAVLGDALRPYVRP